MLLNYPTDQQVWNRCASNERPYAECQQLIRRSHVFFMEKCAKESRSQQFCSEVLIQKVIGNFRFPTETDSSRKLHSVTNNTMRHAVALCAHNGRGETSFVDIAEHVGNGEFGSSARDFVESDVGKASISAVESVFQTIGDEVMRDDS